MTNPIQGMNEFAGERKQTQELAPENTNDEQVDQPSQAQRVAAQAKEHASKAASTTAGTTGSPTESMKVASPGVDNVAGSEKDVIEEMREMEDTGKIDNGAFEGEPNHDDNTSKYS